MHLTPLPAFRQNLLFQMAGIVGEESGGHDPDGIAEYYCRERCCQSWAKRGLTARQCEGCWLFGRYGISPAIIAARWGMPAHAVVDEITVALALLR